MRVLVVGAGEVGSSIAASLADEHEVVVVDVDPERVDQLTYAHDVLAVEGDGTSLDTLEDADAAEADLVVASTDDDETNLATCATVKTVSDAFTIARVKKTTYLRTWQRSHGVFGVDFMVCTDLLAAQAVVRIVGLPTARDVDPFAQGRVQMAEFDVPEGSPIAGLSVSEADRYEELTFAAVIRPDGEGGAGSESVEIASGNTTIGAGDKVVVIGRPGSVRAFAAAVAPDAVEGEADEVVVVGGSSVGYQTARLLEDRGLRPRLIESNPERARALAERLPGTTVLEHDATDEEFLEREHVGEADLVVAALGNDERNLLVALLAKRVGATRAAAFVDDSDYVDLFETVGVDVAVNPREVTAEEITRFTRKRRMENVAIVEPGTAEVLEIEVDRGSVLCGKTIREAAADLPEGVVIGAITRGDRFVTPRGDTVVEEDDHVVAFVRADALDEAVAKL